MSRYPVRADAGWVPAFEARYRAWLPGALPLIRAHEYGQAFRTYPFPQFDVTPWTPLDLPLAAVRLGLVSTAGLYRRGVDAPFADLEEGDPRVVEIPTDLDPRQLDVAHAHIPEALPRADPNVVLPLEPLRELVAQGVLGGVSLRAFSLVGYRTDAGAVARETAPPIAAGLAADGVTLALLVPV